LEQVTGIEPALSAWEAEVLPLHHTCKEKYEDIIAQQSVKVNAHRPKAKAISHACKNQNAGRGGGRHKILCLRKL
jgi:hypothetical protein